MASRVAEDIGRVPPPFEIRWDAGSGVRVEDEGETESGSGLESSVKISLSPNGPWAPVGVRQLGASSAAAVGVGPNRGTALVVDRRRGCVRAPATLSSLLPFELEARTVRLMPTKHKTKTLGKTFDKRDGDAAVGSIVVEVFESERFFPFLGWQEPKGQLDEFFTARFSRTVSGKRYVFLFIFFIIFAIIKLTACFVQLSQVNLALPGRFTPRGVAVGRRVERGPTERRRVRRRVGVGVRR